MGNILSITKQGKLYRADNSIVFLDENKIKTKIPIKKITQIDIYSNITFDSEMLKLLYKYNIGINFYDHWSDKNYAEINMYNNKGSEKILVKQIEVYQTQRIQYIKKIYFGIQLNLIELLKKYQKRVDIGKKITKKINEIRKINFNNIKINNYLSYEANMWNIFYSSLELIIKKEDFIFTNRSKRPPENKINALISFINTKLYFVVNNEIKKTKLDNRIGFIHELTEESRFSLALDISEIFKPFFTYYFIINNINNKKITKSDFKDEIFLNETGLRKINKLFYDYMNETIYNKKLKRNISYQYLIKLECYKLIKSIYNIEEYNAINFKDIT